MINKYLFMFLCFVVLTGLDFSLINFLIYRLLLIKFHHIVIILIVFIYFCCYQYVCFSVVNFFHDRFNFGQKSGHD